MTDIFEECRERVPARRMAEMYGFQPNHAGFIPCPFHQGDRTASLKLYPGTRGWNCFACNRGGSVIDFVAELFNLAPLEAVRKLNDDFRLGLPLDKTPDKAMLAAVRQRREMSETYHLFERWRNGMIDRLNACFREGHLALQSLEVPADLDRLTDAQSLAIREQARFEYLADVLANGTMEDLMQIFRERGRIERLCEKVLKSTPLRSKAA